MGQIGDWIREMTLATQRMCELGALEGAAGNISLFLPHETPGLSDWLRVDFRTARPFHLPDGFTMPSGVLIISGTGRRLRDITMSPESVLCAIVVDDQGESTLHHSPLATVEPTSEIDSHLGIHALALTGEPSVHAVIHAQPPKLTWLSHIPEYRDMPRLNRQLLRWQPETLVTFPEGIGILPFETPGTPEQGDSTAEAIRRHKLVVWAKHGVVARSPLGPQAVADLIDYAETAASYEATDIVAGRPADGLTSDELRAVARRFGVSEVLIDELPERVLRAEG